MTDKEAIALVEKLLERGRLTTVQEIVFSQSWEGKTYLDIAVNAGYDNGYIKDIGSELWRSLSKALNEKVTKNNLRGVLERYAQQQEANSEISQIHMGEAIDVAKFCGRTQELETLRGWILGDRCRVVTILGMGGLGKTSLSVKIAEQLQGKFDYVIWRSLHHAPTFRDKMGDCLKILSQQQITTLPANSHEQITCLIEHFRKSRCLLILDNFDTLLEHGQGTGTYLDGYAAYGELLWRAGETNHQSCVVITSREKPSEIVALEGDGLAVRTLALSGIELEAAKTILALKGLLASDAQSQQLVDCYRGNPLALKIAATSIRDLYAGNVNHFLASGITLFNGISNLLSQQLEGLSDLQNQIMYWLVIHRESISLTELHSVFTPSMPKLKLMEVLESLVNCNLIERDRYGYTQQPVVMEYVIDRLIKLICQEIITESPQYLLTHALVSAQAKDYIRDSQIQLIVQPILQQLQSIFGSKQQLEYQFVRLITTLQNEVIALNSSRTKGLSPLPVNSLSPLPIDNYAGANLLHLLVHLGTDLTGYDFSRLSIRDCDLRSLTLHRVNFSQAHFQDCLFAATFGGITSVAFSPDGLAFASSDTNGEIQIWDAVNAQQLFICQGHNSWVWNVAFSPKSPILASCGQDHTIKLWNINNGECFRTLRGHINIVTAIAFSPDGQLLASSSTDRTVKVWNLGTGEFIQTLEGHNACVWSVDFHPKGHLLATAGEDNTIKLWNLETGCCVQTLQGHQLWVKAIAFSPDGKTLASGSFDNTVKIWDSQTGECLRTLLGHNSVVTSLAFSPQGDRLVTGSYDQCVRIWDVATGKCLDTLHKHTNRVWSVAFHPQENLVVSGGDDHGIKIWELQRGKCIKTLQGNSNAIYAIAYSDQFNQQNLLASGHEDQTIKLWNININAPQSLELDLQPFQILRGHSDRILSVAFSPNGQILASGSADRTIKLWNPHTGKSIKTLQGHRSWVWEIAISPDNRFLASGSYDHMVKVWDIESGECLQTLQGHPSSVLSVRFSHDGKTLFSSGYDQIVKHWDLETGECLSTWEADSSNRIWAMEISPNSQYLATGGDDHSIKLWDIGTGECLRRFSGHSHPVVSLIFTPNGDRLISGSSDRTIKIWDVLTGNCLETLQGHGHWVASLAISQDAKTLISGSWDETIKCWDIATGKCWQTLRSMLPYKGVIINNVTGLTQVEIDTFKVLGASV